MSEAEDRSVGTMPNTFPQYRKMVGDRQFYLIKGPKELLEIQVVGTKRVLHLLQAEQYPEMVRIKDILEDVGNYPTMTEADWLRELGKLDG